MDNDAVIKKMSEYLKSHNTMTLATVAADGKPLAHTVEYASDGTTVYFVTNRLTRKARNIAANPHVAFTVDEDYLDWSKIQGIQMEAVATMLADKAELEKAAGIYVGKFPIVKTFPPNPDWVFVKLAPSAGFFLDYTKGFTHRDKVEF